MENSRRKLLKALTVCGSAATVAKLPATWSSPVVKSVVLPAHAAATTCVIRVEFSLFFDGSFGGGGGFTIYDSSGCRETAGQGGPWSDNFSFPDLGPGTYYFDGGGGFGGSGGSGSISVAVFCCNEMEEASDSFAGSLGGADVDLVLEIIIREDGTCSLRRVDRENLPPPPAC